MVKNLKKAQVKIQQTAIMLMALTLFFVLAGVFLVSLKVGDLKKDATLLEEKNTITLASKLSSSPEFSCEEAFSEKRINCVDSDKLMVLSEKSELYSDFWDVSSIEVRKIYPEFSRDIICTSQNYPNCNLFKVLGDSSGISSWSFVSLCRVDYSQSDSYIKCELAKLSISYNKK